MRLSKPTTKKWMKIDPYYHRQKCRPLTLVSGNIRYKLIFAGILWRGASNDSGITENVDFLGFRTLCLWQLRKWGQHHYIVLAALAGTLFTGAQRHARRINAEGDDHGKNPCTAAWVWRPSNTPRRRWWRREKPPLRRKSLFSLIAN